MTERNASLVLKTSDFTADPLFATVYPYNTSRGSCNSKLSSLTWNNINLRTLLGDIYDDYDIFNLCLNSISTSLTPAYIDTISTNSEFKNVSIKISGLPFINQTYNVKNCCNGNSTTIATFNFIDNQATTQSYYSSNVATFGKSQEQCSFTIEYYKIIDDSLALPLNSYPNTIFIFDIFGIPKDKSNPNGSRLIP